MNEIIDQQRNRIDEVDKLLIDLLSERFDAARIIGMQKQLNSIHVLDKLRESEVLDDRASYAESKRIDPGFVRRLIQMIMDESKSIQNQST